MQGKYIVTKTKKRLHIADSFATMKEEYIFGVVTSFNFRRRI